MLPLVGQVAFVSAVVKQIGLGELPPVEALGLNRMLALAMSPFASKLINVNAKTPSWLKSTPVQVKQIRFSLICGVVAVEVPAKVAATVVFGALVQATNED